VEERTVTKGKPRDEERETTHDADAQLADALIQLVGGLAHEKMDPADPRNAAFFDWRARELRRRRTPAEVRDDEKRAATFAQRMVRRLTEETLGFRDAHGGPELSPAPSATSIAGAVDAAAAARSAPHMDLAVAAGVGRELWDEECVEWAAVPDDIPAGRHLALRVAGQSMMPYLHPGDTVLVRLGDSVARGRVVVARRPDDGYVVKRVGKVRRCEVELVSLNPDFEPIIVPRDSRLILGTVVLRWCAHSAPCEA
jgi:SOS-response transcriptional repressor LexA